MSREPDQLSESGMPIFFDVGNASDLGLSLPDNRHGQSVRAWARSLSVMQKEAIVVSCRSGRAWRLASDEGLYLNGFDSAPCPLSFLTTGMVASFMTEILALAAERGISIDEIVLIQDNRYTMKGSALDGSMRGGALPVELDARIRSTADTRAMTALVEDAVEASPATGLLRGELTSLFALQVNGEPTSTGRVAALETGQPASPRRLFEGLEPVPGPDPQLVRKIEDAEVVHGVDGGVASSLKATQERTLHVRGTCRLLPDGRKQIDQELFSPIGSRFRFISDESPGFGGAGAAPDAVTYLSAGIAFCFMTQLGRYAKILRKNLEYYDVVQDIHFSAGGASGGTNLPGRADPVETQVFLGTNEDVAFARTMVDMGEQTCFLHALCRTDLETKVRVRKIDGTAAP